MKGDFSRRTFDPSKHYRSVQMQQGRVQLDADWNEQSDIAAHRVETEAQDVIGEHGAPLHEAGFHIVTDIGRLTAEEREEPGNNPKPMPELAQPGDFFVSAGRYYVDGILCENESITTYRRQPDPPGPPDPPTAGRYLVYLDVWQRHLTALDNPSLRETALGGPDTATRVKTVWQVRWRDTTTSDCATASDQLKQYASSCHGKLKARAAVPPGDDDLCTLAPSGGYRGLENQLYRVEVHHRGGAYAIPADDTDVHEVTAMSGSPVDTITVRDGTWSVGDWVEVFCTTSPGGGTTGVDPMAGYLARVVALGSTNLVLSLDRFLPNLMERTPKVRRLGQQDGAPLHATFKWSRDNGTVVTEITAIKAGASGDTEITVHDLGPDEVLGFAADQWVEIADDSHELSGTPGQLAWIVSVNPKPAGPIVTVKGRIDFLAAGSDTGVEPGRHPKLRRWDGVGLVKYLEPGYPESASKNWQHLEDGIQVQFPAGTPPGTYETGDYWLIPARAVTAEAEIGHIEWPGKKDDPQALPPAGIKHHYAPLAILLGQGEGAPEVLSDCRALFPPLTEATLVYVSGDGQEAMPGEPLPAPLQVGVFRGLCPVANRQVRFRAVGKGWVAEFPALPSPGGSTSVDTTTGSDGIASCNWLMDAARDDATTWQTPQRVEARLVDSEGVPFGPPVYFNANLSIAGQVAYTVTEHFRPSLPETQTVQEAIDTIGHLARLCYLSGDGQDVELPELRLPLPVGVAVASDCGPVFRGNAGGDVRVRFVVEEGARVAAKWEDLDNPATPNFTELSVTNQDGTVECYWRLNATGKSAQSLAATLVAAGGNPIGAPQYVQFTANLGVEATGESCCIVVEPEQASELREIILGALGKEGGVCICLKPGVYELPHGLNVESPASSETPPSLTITGCGGATEVVAMNSSLLSDLGSVTWRDLTLRLGRKFDCGGNNSTAIRFLNCREVVISGCHLEGGLASLGAETRLCGVEAAIRLEVRSSSFQADGIAPVLGFGGEAEVHLEESTFGGPLALYGMPVGEPLSREDLAKLRSYPQPMRLGVAGFSLGLPPRTRFEPVGGTLYARGNTIGSIRIDGDLARRVREAGPESSGLELPEAYGAAFLANNTIEGRSELVAREASLSANAVLANAAVIAHSAVYVGNHTRPAQLAHVGPEGRLIWRGDGFLLPSAVSVFPEDGSCWVTDVCGNQVVHLSVDGAELWRREGLSSPFSISVNSADGSCWVADTLNNRVMHLSATGTELWQGGKLNRPMSVSVNPADGSCWVADTGNNQVVHLLKSGEEVFRSPGGPASHTFRSPLAVSVHSGDGTCWVADTLNGQVVHLSRSGAELHRVGGFDRPMSVSVNPTDDTCWVANTGKGEVVHLSANGEDLWRGGGFKLPTSVSVSTGDFSCWVGYGALSFVPVSAHPFDGSCWVGDGDNGQVAHVLRDGRILWQGSSIGVTVFSSAHAEEQCANLRVVIAPV